MVTIECEISASGLGCAADVYEKLLRNICKSGVKLTKIRIIPGLVSILIIYSVSGTENEIKRYREYMQD